jgi:Carboxypeptidase regulatory-like domain
MPSTLEGSSKETPYFVEEKQMSFSNLLPSAEGVMTNTKRLLVVLLSTMLLLVGSMFAQETTGGLQGTVKDPSGAVVSNAKVVITGTSLIGNKEAQTDGSGYYHFTNLPPGTYTLTVTASGFETLKRDGLVVEVGHLPSVDLKLDIGAGTTVVEVSGQSAQIDVTTETTQTNVTSDVIDNVPHGRSFQSVIQFAPAASNEPLGGSMGTSGGNGTGGQSPGSSGNGQAFGYSVAGGADSENRYLVEGQETADIIGGFSHTQVPFDIIQEVQVKTSGVQAEYGGALGGVVNVVMKKGSNAYHGSVFTQFENDAMDGGPNSLTRYNPLDSGNSVTGVDPSFQLYQPKKDKTSDFFPGFTLGGPVLKDRIWFFLAFNPELARDERTIDYSQSTNPAFQPLGTQSYSQNTDTYYTTARIDANVSQKVRVFGSWLYQLQRQTGESLPGADSTTGFNPNASATCQADANCAGFDNVYNTIPVIAFGHELGFTAPNTVANFGADITLTPSLVSTTRFGYFFQNYHDFGYPTTGVTDFWQANGNGATDVNGVPIPTSTGLVQGSGYFNAPQNQNYTVVNANKRFQFDQGVSWFKSGWWGTHNLKFGYQLNRSSNQINQRWNQPFVQIFPGATNTYFAAGSTGFANCAALVATYGPQYGDPAGSNCTGTYGYAVLQDYGSLGYAVSFNHGLFAQDAWTIGHGITINAGLRVEKEYLPGESANLTEALPAHPIDFGWGDKIAPRIGAAWDVFKDGRMKVFGSYGVFNDNMKLNLAISSFGGQYWNNCAYAMMDPNSLQYLDPVRDSSGHYCSPVGGSTTPGNFGTTPPAGSLIFLENSNERGTEGVTPGLKPYRQHESEFGLDYQLGPHLALESRWDRRRLDRVIEDAALFNSSGEEVFTIVNPGYGENAVNATCANTTVTGGAFPVCPPNPKGARSYDGVEFRLTRTNTKHWFGMASYTYSHFRGNYTGLSSTDISDGGGGRNAPNNSRAFDETYFSFNANGGSSSGLLPTDRPNKFKGYGYYELGWKRKFSTDIGLFQYAYQGSPVSSFIDVGYSVIPGNFFAVYPEDRGKWVNVTGTTGNLSIGNAYTRRTPWFTQTDLSLSQNYKISETKVLSFSATIPNALNQRAVTAYNEQVDSQQFASFLQPGGVPFYFGGVAYSAYEHPYDWRALANSQDIIPDSKYGQPYLYQLSRNIRLRVGFTF